ncbi:MAG: hypothetical protein A4S09_03960 [Proteobacteria bacterium SG_bin7]|nr:MAG: hypothetical protein A4S09_03960 [Proteobacteria bacterium SG_bin7]
MKSLYLIAGGFLLWLNATSYAQNEPDWSAPVPENGRVNPYNLDVETFQMARNQGQIHAQIYPVSVTGALPPYKPIESILGSKDTHVFRRWLNQIFKSLVGLHNLNDVLELLGLHDYPKENDVGVYKVAYPNNKRPDYKIGFGIVEKGSAQGFTFSCATCHSGNLFGKTVLGLTNRFVRANEFFAVGKLAIAHVPPPIFRFYTGATAEETEMFNVLQRNLKGITAKKPLAIGLDTSLAQVSLSLNRRNSDEIASKNSQYEKNPRPDLLDNFPADSKPAVWWNVKYKNRWLSDGSVVSGNPIFTNILWNEIGRGADLELLEKWLSENPKTIQELVTAVFSAQAPRITDFFSENQIDVGSAKAGQTIFREMCMRCHGDYVKRWEQPGFENLSIREQIETVSVRYKPTTVAVDVGTDPNRYLGMRSLEKLNDLRISKNNRILIQFQKGYVPPPLVGIWARWPYLHNNSIPNLCALLTRADERPKHFFQGAAVNSKTDFDFDCNGYPVGEKTPPSWRTRAMSYSADREGMHNFGHDEGIFLRDGQELLTMRQKRELIFYLQTL